MDESDTSWDFLPFSQAPWIDWDVLAGRPPSNDFLWCS